jgi:hypothetical protein
MKGLHVALCAAMLSLGSLAALAQQSGQPCDPGAQDCGASQPSPGADSSPAQPPGVEGGPSGSGNAPIASPGSGGAGSGASGSGSSGSGSSGGGSSGGGSSGGGSSGGGG